MDFNYSKTTSHYNVACFECFSLEVCISILSKVHVDGPLMFLQQNGGLGRFLSNPNKQISKPH